MDKIDRHFILDIDLNEFLCFLSLLDDSTLIYWNDNLILEGDAGCIVFSSSEEAYSDYVARFGS